MIFFDMDGVLCDFVRGACEAHGSTLHTIPHAIDWDFPKKMSFPQGAADPSFWAPLSNARFWAELKPLADGMQLFRRVEDQVGPNQIALLSSGVCPGSCDGKREWLKQHLPGYEKRAVFCHIKGLVASPGKLLIDDHEPNIESFRANHGQTVLVPRNWNTAAAYVNQFGGFDVEAVFAAVIREFVK